MPEDVDAVLDKRKDAITNNIAQRPRATANKAKGQQQTKDTRPTKRRRVTVSHGLTTPATSQRKSSRTSRPSARVLVSPLPTG